MRKRIRHLWRRFEYWLAEKAISIGNSIVEKEQLEIELDLDGESKVQWIM